MNNVTQPKRITVLGAGFGALSTVRELRRRDRDALVIATGGRFQKKLPGIEHAITPCEGITAAERIRDRLRDMPGGTIAVGFVGNPNEPTAVRGGPMFEFLFGIDEQLRREGRRERFEIVFFNPSTEPGNRLGPKAVKHLLVEMARRGIRTHLGHKVKRFEADKVVTEGGEFAADLILFMPGMTGNTWFDATTLPRSPGGLLQADGQCRIPGAERTCVVGDSGSFPGPDWMSKQAPMADLQAAAAAENLLGDLQGRSSNASRAWLRTRSRRELRPHEGHFSPIAVHQPPGVLNHEEVTDRRRCPGVHHRGGSRGRTVRQHPFRQRDGAGRRPRAGGPGPGAEGHGARAAV
jgi:NADPH-dependent 2,4-dienoyl-CoA reductase/sulfur reductase-like enzyme